LTPRKGTTHSPTYRFATHTFAKAAAMSTPRTILMHMDETARMGERIRFARMLSESLDADIVCRPCSMPGLMPYPLAFGAAAPAVQAMRAAQEASRDRLYRLFTEYGGGSPRLHWIEPDSAAPWDFARHAFYADLMLLGQRDRNDPMDPLLPADFLPSLLMQSGRPAVVFPYADKAGPIGRTVLVAWNESRESARALSAALPWLRTASVHAVVYGGDVQQPLERLRAFLHAHGVADPRLHAGGHDGDVGNQLLSLAADLGADLLVMGCYGHSRAREWVLGGATRTVLQSMTLPVLLSH
jgi:nucleotide-binding universal stress UspA family protein